VDPWFGMGGPMGEKSETGKESATGSADGSSSWGPKLFVAVLLGALAFFWWLLIYSGGVTLQH